MARQPLILDVLDAVRGKKLTPADKLLLAYLAYRQGHNPDTWPSVNTICEDLGFAIQTVLDSTERLVGAGVLGKTPGKRGRGWSHRYVVCLKKSSEEQKFSQGEKALRSRIEEPAKTSEEQNENFYSSEENLSRIGQARSARIGSRISSPRKSFTPPTVSEVRQYAASLGQPAFTAEKFVEHYGDLDWHDVAGHPVRNWRCKVRRWLKRDTECAILAQDESDREDAEIDAKLAYGAARLAGGQR